MKLQLHELQPRCKYYVFWREAAGPVTGTVARDICGSAWP